MSQNKELWVGIDVGSTTVKIAVIDPKTHELLHSKYMRHNAKQALTVYDILTEAHSKFSGSRFMLSVSGSGSEPIVAALDSFFIQEVVANSIAIKEFHPETSVAIELGGQDAKVIFFSHDEETGQILASDMRMNGSCAGGTGAFIDQVAELLNIKTEDFQSYASKGKTVYDISGRCGVFAKTDIQPLLNQGVSREDIALSTFHAIAKQTIGGLAQGMEITPPVIFEGGPLTFNPRLVEVFAERLALKPKQVLIPKQPETIVAYGTALSIGVMFENQECSYIPENMENLKDIRKYRREDESESAKLFFESEKERQEFLSHNQIPVFQPKQYQKGNTANVYLGIDAGSTTSKFVLLDESEEIVDKFYANNDADPLKVIQKALIQMRDKYRNNGVQLNIIGVGTTGYGENLFAKAFKADYHTVETVSHAEAAMKYAPDVSFILDIGGQDMKAIHISNGIVTGIILNEACSAGCGSFIETYAKSLKIAVKDVADLAFKSQNPSQLGSRCTVFMNSSIVTEQKNGKTTEDIMAGISKSIIENVFTKVVRIPNFNMLGEVILVQGGTFKNDAVLRALEQYTGRKVVRPPHPGEMGAIGVALLTKKYFAEQAAEGHPIEKSSFIGLENLEEFSYEKIPGSICHFCSNNCNRTIVKFNDGSSFVTGNRCERGEIVGDIKDKSVKEQLRAATHKLDTIPDMLAFKERLVFEDYHPNIISHPKQIRIGLPRSLEFWNSMPFWRTLFQSLGFETVFSAKSSYKLFEEGLQFVPSDTVCFPAKMVHGHIEDLIKKKVDRIFFPMMINIEPENTTIKEAVHMCAVVQGYPIVVQESNEPQRRGGVLLDRPSFRWYNRKLRDKQIFDWFSLTFGLHQDVIALALKEADRAMADHRKLIEDEGKKILDSLKGTNDFSVLISGRPYHADSLINHSLSKHFTALGIPVIISEALPGIRNVDLSKIRGDLVNPFHARMYGSAILGAQNPNLEIVQIVSFGCGHDAVITDEMTRIIKEISDKQLLVLKLDEGEAKGPLNIRIKSFIETIRAKRKRGNFTPIKELSEPYELKFEKKDKKLKTILVPNLSEAFTEIVSSVIQKEGFKVELLPLAGKKAIELGKKYVHNDICYPAQINVGEILAALEDKKFDPNSVALGLAKNCDDCRAGQYAALARKALDEAGYPQIKIVTTGVDTRNMHPGFSMSLLFQVRMLWGLAMTDAMENARLRIRPYEANKGQTDTVFEHYIKKMAKAMKISYRKAFKVFKEAANALNQIPLVEQERKPRVFIIGEILMNYHPTANGNIVRYLEANGMEVMLPTMVDFFRRDLIRVQEGVKHDQVVNPFLEGLVANLSDNLYSYVLKKIAGAMKAFKLYEPLRDVHEIAGNIENFIDKTYMVGEGWTIPAEIIEHAREGVNSFVIVQPFGCLPNHITGRGMTKTVKKMFPHIQVLSLDYDPDTSFANVENRLQMLIITAREIEKVMKEKADRKKA